MSRVIKFRVMDIDGNWHYYTLGDFVCQTPIPAQIRPETWAQFTGLLDVNGVEIYEGDIVSVPGTGTAEVKICPAYGVVFSDTEGFELAYIDGAAESDFPTIIGNIHQNPELLK